jgi:hypothetical protein
MHLEEKHENHWKRLRSLLHHPSGYPELLWLICVFFGGAINAVAIKNFVDWFYWAQQEVQSQFHTDLLNTLQAYPVLLLYGGIVFALPVILSLLFSRLNSSEKRIVPPLYIQLVSFGFLIALAYNSIVDDFITYYYIILLGVTAGLVQDGLVVTSLGKSATKDSILPVSFRTCTDIEKVKSLLLSKQFRRLRGLRIIKTKSQEPLRLRSYRGWPIKRYGGFQFVMEVQKDNQSDDTIINIATFQSSSYSINKIDEGDETYEISQNKIASLVNTLERQEIWLVKDSPSKADSLVGYVLEGNEGYFTRMREMSFRRVVIGVSAILSVAISLGFIAIGRIDTGIAGLALGAFLAIDGVLHE